MYTIYLIDKTMDAVATVYTNNIAVQMSVM